MIKMLIKSVVLVFALSILSACATETNPNIESSRPTPSAPPTSQSSSQQSSSSESTSSAVEPLKEEADAWKKQYKYISSISEGLIVVEDKNGKWGAVDANGNIIIPLEYEYLESFSNGTAYCCNADGKLGVINTNNEVIAPFEYDTFYPETEGRLIVVKDHKWGVIDDSGNIVIPVEYTHVASFSDGWAVCYKGDKAGMVNLKNEVVIPFEYGYLSSFSEGLAVFQTDGLYGHIDKNNQVVIPPIYQRAGPFVDGVAAVFPFVESIWLEDTPYTLQKEPDYTLWQINYIDTKGNTLYASDTLRDVGWSPFASTATVYTMSGQWRIFDLSGYQAEDFDINGLYGTTKSGTYLQNETHSFWWGAFKGEPIYKVVDLQESTPYQDFSSAELLALYGQ